MEIKAGSKRRSGGEDPALGSLNEGLNVTAGFGNEMPHSRVARQDSCVYLRCDYVLEVRDGELIISPSDPVRAGWSEAAELLAERAEDQLLDASSLPTRFDAQECKW